jgi:hypothetical protein
VSNTLELLAGSVFSLESSLQLIVSHPDNVWLAETISACKWLGLAFFFTDDQKYAHQLKERLSTFFLNPVTAMAPTMVYAQSIPGQVDGRSQVRFHTLTLF